MLLARETPVVPAYSSSLPVSSVDASSVCRRQVIDGHQETLEGGAESAR